MDTRIKFTIKKKYSNNKETDSFSLPQGYIDKTKSNSIIVDFNEYEEVYIKFDYESDDCSILIDTYNEDVKINARSGEYITLNLPMKENSLVPGYYEIEVNNQEKFLCYFKVEPKNIEWQELINLKEILDKYIKGICSDFNLSKSSYNHEGNSDILEYYQNQYNLWQEIKWSVKLVMNNPDGEYEKIYSYSCNQNKIDRKTIRSMSKYFGDKLSKNYYTYKKRVNHITPDNMILYDKLQRYRDTLAKNIFNIKKLYRLEKNKIDDINIEYIQKDNKLKSIEHSKVLSERYKSSIKNRVSYLGKIKYIQSNKIKQIEKIHKMLNHITLEVEDLIFEIQEKLGIYKIDENSKHVIKNLRYRNIGDMLDEMLEAKSYEYGSTKKEEVSIFRFRKTELLFEYLCLIRVIESILSMGYTCESGWFQKIINQEYDLEIPSESESYFVNDNITIVISYDKEAPTSIESDYEGLYSFNSRHRRPDISILVYKNNEFIKALIVEVKCRNSRYIYSSQGDTSVVDTMKDYGQLCYYKGQKLKRDAVDKVITLYPNQKYNIKVEKNEFMDIFSFIPLNINQEITDSKLYNEIETFIEQCIK